MAALVVVSFPLRRTSEQGEDLADGCQHHQDEPGGDEALEYVRKIGCSMIIF